MTKENLEEIQKLKKLYDEQHYVQQLQKALGLEGFVLFSEKPSISFLSFTNFVKELLGVKTAYAGTASNAACAFPIIGLYDSAVGLTSSGLSSALEAMSFSDAGQVCRNVLEYAKVGANLDRIANACPIVGAVNRHLSLDNFLTSTYTFFVSCRDCMSGQTYVAGYGCCPSDEEDRCKCIAEGGVYIGDCCHKKDGTIDCSSLSFTKDFVNDMKKISNTLTGFFSQED